MEGRVKLSFTKLAEVSGVSEASCRRYVKKAPELFMAETQDGVTRFPHEAVERFKMAHGSLAAGLRWGEMVRALQAKFGAVIEVSEVQAEKAEALDLSGIGEKLDRLVVAVEALAVAQKENASLRDRVERLEAALGQGMGDASAIEATSPASGGGGFWSGLGRWFRGS